MAPIIEKGTRVRIRREGKTSFAWQVFKGVVKLAALVLIGTVVWHVTRLPFFSITEIAVSGGETISHDEVKNQAEGELQGTYFHLIPKRFSYLYPHDRLIEVLEKNSRMHNTVITRTSRQAIDIAFEEYFPHALWCNQNEIKTCFFMTSDGYVFAEAPILHGGSLVRHMKEGQEVVDKGNAISKEMLAFIEIFIQRLDAELGLRVSSVLHKNNGDITMYINGGGMVFVTGGGDLTPAFENLKAVIASKEFSHIRPGNFQYIDVRFDNKAFVNENPIPIEGIAAEASSTLPQ